MKNRTIIRARAKTAAAFYKGKLAEVRIRTFEECVWRDLPKDHSRGSKPWHVHIYVTGQLSVEEAVGFDTESDAKCFADDLCKFCDLVEA